MKYRDSMKRMVFCAVTLLLCWWVLPGVISGVDEIAAKSVLSEGKGSSFVIKDVRAEEKTVMRSSSEHFILEWMEREVAGKGQEEAITGLASQPGLPKAYSLSQNYPNPFNPSTTITFDLPGTIGTKQRVSLNVYDIRGRLVKTLIDSDLEPGSHKIHWNGRNDRFQPVASGIYLYILKASEERFTRKMTVLK